MCCDDGMVLAHNKKVHTGVYGFRCPCNANQSQIAPSIPQWRPHFTQEFVLVTEDPSRPTDEWIIEHFRKGTTGSVEFQRRLETWGRDRFEDLYKKYRLTEGKTTSNTPDYDTTNRPAETTETTTSENKGVRRGDLGASIEEDSR